MNIACKTPWESSMGPVPMHLDYFQGSMFELVESRSVNYSNGIALNFMGSKITYKTMLENIKKVAASFRAVGLKKGDHILIAMPNSPQAIYAFYAANLLGVISHMVHPLSAEKEVLFYIKDSNCKLVLTVNSLYHKFIPAIKAGNIDKFLLADIKDVLNPFMKVGYALTTGRKIKKIPEDSCVIFWKDFIVKGVNFPVKYAKVDKNDVAVVLYSGGTTGTSKVIALSNFNFNDLADQIIATNPMYKVGDKMLAALPLFHGFGLGVCVHSMLSNGGHCILVPRFTAETYSLLIAKYKCNFIAGVPTLFEALTRMKSMIRIDLSYLKGVFSGGDSLSVELKKKFDKFLSDRNAPICIREGYGTTECLAASCLTPITNAKEGSIGIPFPDTYYKIVKPDSFEELPYGEEGEIIISGPTVMQGYTNNPKETSDSLKQDENGMTWLFTGDLGAMDSDGFIYFRGRIKRLIVTSGYNVYPSQIENIIEEHNDVQMSCVIGVPDAYKMHKVKAFVVLKKGIEACQKIKDDILEHCRKAIAKYAMPYDIEFRDDLPKTTVGKIAYRVLEEEELKKYRIN